MIALRTACLKRMDDVGLLTAGKLEASFVERACFDAVEKYICRSIAGRTIEAMVNCWNCSACCGRMLLPYLGPIKNRAYINLSDR